MVVLKNIKFVKKVLQIFMDFEFLKFNIVLNGLCFESI